MMWVVNLWILGILVFAGVSGLLAGSVTHGLKALGRGVMWPAIIAALVIRSAVRSV